MFTIHQSDPTSLRSFRVINFDENISLEMVSGIGRTLGGAFVLRTNDKAIPFETKKQDGLRDSFGLYQLTQFDSFNNSMYASRKAGIGPAQFESEVELQTWKIVAVEALLIFGGSYNGFDAPPKYHRVEVDGRVFTRADFGYSR